MGQGELFETIPMHKGNGTFFPSDVEYDPADGPVTDIVRPMIPVGKSDPAIQQAIDSHRRNLLR